MRFDSPSRRSFTRWIVLCSIVQILCCLYAWPSIAAAQCVQSEEKLELSGATRAHCLRVLRAGLRSDEFWPAMHAAEGLTIAGYGDEVREYLSPKLPLEADDQRRCGLARELARAGDRSQVRVMLEILTKADPHGHVHAAESLYKVEEIGDGVALRRAFTQSDNVRLRLMAAAALGRSGSPHAMAYLREMLPSDDPEVAKIAAWVLAILGDSNDLPQLRKNFEQASDPLARAYYEHALATLGDAAGRQALAANLRDDDPVVQTYAANFACDARALEVCDPLTDLLDHENLDVRIRAAHSLLDLAQAPRPHPRDEFSHIVDQATAEHPRYTEGSVLELSNGSLLYATTQFDGSGSDFATARIVARQSQDGGRSWTPRRVLQESTGEMNVMSVTLRRLGPPAALGTIAMFYLQKNGFDDLQVWVRFSTDEAATFGEPVRVTTEPGYHVMNNDRVTQLSSGRLLAPVATTTDVRQVNHFVSVCWLSDDGGRSWRKSRGAMDLPRRGAMEPEVIELADGRVLMIARTQLGYIATSHSADGGDTWSEPAKLTVQAPEAPATLRRIPATGDLLLIWNNNYDPTVGHGGRRTPLTSAISTDEGLTWSQLRNLETDADRTYSYTSVLFARGRAVLSYWESEPGTQRLSSRIRSLPIGWFYTPEAP